MSNLRLVLDLNATIAAMRSQRGASAPLLILAQSERYTLVLSVPLIIEYEAICSKPEHQTAASLSNRDYGSVTNKFGVEVLLPAEVIRRI